MKFNNPFFTAKDKESIMTFANAINEAFHTFTKRLEEIAEHLVIQNGNNSNYQQHIDNINDLIDGVEIDINELVNRVSLLENRISALDGKKPAVDVRRKAKTKDK